ncbi:MAG TPA: hypothetical protein VL422_05465 [Miltoncostaea sp.]|nr:hypothetical protein [Miltoncostaea sp.]
MYARATALLVVLALAVAGCGGGTDDVPAASGDGSRVAAATVLREAFTNVSAAADGLDTCGSRRCLRGMGRDLHAAADEAVSRLSEVDRRPLPACYADAIEQATRAMTAYRRAGIAFEGVDNAAAQAAIARAGRFEAGVTRSIAACPA